MNSTAHSPANLEVVLDIPVELSVELGTCHLPMRQVLQLEPGSIVQLDKTADAPVDVYVNHKLVARGEVVVLDDHFGIRITEVVGRQTEERPAQPAQVKPAPAQPPAQAPVQPSPRSTTPGIDVTGLQP